MDAPEHLKYCESHEWIEAGEEIAKVGISDHAQAELSDVVFVELPSPGRTVAARDPVAVVESVKAASDIYAPVAGEIVEVNTALDSNPALINSDPYGQGWIFKIKIANQEESEALKDSEAYLAGLG